jgi:hypothetical protein
MSEDLKDRFFDVLMRNLNYSIEFVNQRGYASLRFMDLFSSLLELQPFIKEIDQEGFYEKLREKIKARQLVRQDEIEDREERSKLQSELLQMFVEEWKRRTSPK